MVAGAGIGFLLERAAQGQLSFTTADVAAALGRSPEGTHYTIDGLRRQGLVATPTRGFHVVVLPEYRRLGCLPPEQLTPLLFRFWNQRYYVGLLSAARLLGAAHQQPQVFQVVTAKARTPIECGSVKIAFVARRNLTKMTTTKQNTPRGSLVVSSPEATALDLVAYVDRAGGLDNVATVLRELGPSMKVRALRVQLRADVVDMPVLQRLGWLLDQVGQRRLAALIEPLVAKAVHTAALSTTAPIDGAPRDPTWKLFINHQLETDT